MNYFSPYLINILSANMSKISLLPLSIKNQKNKPLNGKN